MVALQDKLHVLLQHDLSRSDLFSHEIFRSRQSLLIACKRQNSPWIRAQLRCRQQDNHPWNFSQPSLSEDTVKDQTQPAVSWSLCFRQQAHKANSQSCFHEAMASTRIN